MRRDWLELPLAIGRDQQWNQMVIAFINQKGGCGKSSSCFHLGGCLAQLGLRTLLIDADPQGSLSQAFFGAQFVEGLSASKTLAATFNGSLCMADSLVAETGVSGLHIVQANHHLAVHNVPEPHLKGPAQWSVRGLLEQLPDFEAVLIDCPPNLYQCSWNAILAADCVVIPVPPEDFGTQGLRAVHLAVTQAQGLNSDLKLRGHLITRVDRRLQIHRYYIDKLREVYGAAVLETMIPEAVAFKLSLTFRTPVTLHQPRSAAADSIGQLAHELLGAPLKVPANQSVVTL